MKKGIKIVFVVLLMSLLFAACVTDYADYNDTEAEPASYAEDDEVGEVEVAVAPGLWDYMFIWPEGRDREWEEDVISFAQAFLFVHPLMRNVQIPITDVQSILSDADSGGNMDLFHDAALRERFLEHIHELIAVIPELEDHAIIFSLSEIAALLEDAHTGFMLDRHTFRDFESHYYPFFFTHFSDGFFVDRVNLPADYEHALDSRLVAINGVRMDEIIGLAANVIPHENTHDIAARLSLFDLLRHSEFLMHLGVTDGGEAEFMFESPAGDMFSITTSPHAEEEAETLSSSIDREALLTHSRPDWQWYEFLEEYNMMYVRLYNFFRAIGAPAFGEIYQSLAEETRYILDTGAIDRFVVDLRGNRGGFLNEFDMLFDLIYAERNRIRSVYVLMDRHTYSSGVIAAAILREYIDEVLLVGEPTSQPPNFFAAPSTYWLHNAGISFTVSSVHFHILPEYPGNALYPDIRIPMTFEDFKNGRDPVLEAVLSG